MAKKILVVDDEESLRVLVSAILEQEGYEVETASSGADCLEKLKKLKPDLILLDVMMPGMTGTETLEKLWANPKTKNLKVAFLTVVKSSKSGKGAIKEMNVSDYITKPFDNTDLIKRIKKILGQ